MAFDKAPSEWLTNYEFDGTTISFDLGADYTASMADPLSFAYRIADNIQKKYEQKTEGDRPTRWVSSVNYVQPVATSPDIQKIITNKITLEADLFGGLASPNLSVSIQTPDSEYNGSPYSKAVLLYPAGSTVVLEYSSDAGLSWTTSAPSSRGSYTARLTATKNGRIGVATSVFLIGKTTPSISTSGNITAIMEGGDQTGYFFCSQPITAVISQNPSIVSIQNFEYDEELERASVVVSINAIGQTSIVAETTENSDYYSVNADLSIVVNGTQTSIETPASIEIDSAIVSQNQTDFTDFSTIGFSKTSDYALIQFSSSDTTIATISKGSSYPPKINLAKPGTFTLSINFLGDSVRAPASGNTSVLIIGLPLTLGVTAYAGRDLNSLYPDAAWVDSTGASKLLTEISSQDTAEYYRSIDTQTKLKIQIGPQNNQFSYSFTYLYGASWATVSKSGNAVTLTFSSIPTVSGAGTVVIGKLVVTRPSTALYKSWQNTFNVSVYIPPTGGGGGGGGGGGDGGVDPTDPGLKTPSITVINATDLYGGNTDFASLCNSFQTFDPPSYDSRQIVVTGNQVQNALAGKTIIKVNTVPSSLMWYGNACNATLSYLTTGEETLAISSVYRASDGGAVYELTGTGKPGTEGFINVSLPQNSYLGYKSFTISKSVIIKKTFPKISTRAEQITMMVKYKASNTSAVISYEAIVLQYARVSFYGAPCNGSVSNVYHSAEKIPLVVLPVPASMSWTNPSSSMKPVSYITKQASTAESALGYMAYTYLNRGAIVYADPAGDPCLLGTLTGDFLVHFNKYAISASGSPTKSSGGIWQVGAAGSGSGLLPIGGNSGAGYSSTILEWADKGVKWQSGGRVKPEFLPASCGIIPNNASVRVFIVPDHPYREGVLGDYFDFTGLTRINLIFKNLSWLPTTATNNLYFSGMIPSAPSSFSQYYYLDDQNVWAYEIPVTGSYATVNYASSCSGEI